MVYLMQIDHVFLYNIFSCPEQSRHIFIGKQYTFSKKKENYI